MIQIQEIQFNTNTDLDVDPGCQIKTDPHGSGSEKLLFLYIASSVCRPYLHLMLYMLMLEDSWQNHRIMKALKGTQLNTTTLHHVFFWEGVAKILKVVSGEMNRAKSGINL